MTPPLQQYVADARHALNTQPYLRAAVYGLAALLVFNSIWRYIKYKVTDRYTAMYDVEFVGRPRKGPKLPGTAVVAGGSFSGLLCARMLSDHYEKVLVVESEDIRPGQLRKFVLQYQQLHTFLAFVTKFMFKLWPDFREQMRLQGAKAGPFTFPFFLGDHTRQDPEEYLFDTLYISRAGMETIVRKLVLERCPNIEIRYRQSVTSIELNERKRVRAVNIRDGDKTASVECALLIDATGPAIASRKWLPKVGFTSPEKVTYDPGVTYSSTIFDLKKLPNRDYVDPKGEDQVGYIYGCRPPVGESRLSGYMSRIENDQLLVCAATWNGSEGLPRKIEEFPAYFKQLPHWPEHQLMIQSLSDAMPDNEVIVTRPPPCHRIKWMDVSIPDNFIPIGDTVQKLNAQYGQGCSQACVCSATLNKMLYDEEGPELSADFGNRYVKRLFGRITYLWDASRLTDYGWENTKPCPNESLKDGTAERWIQKQVITAMQCDPEVSRTVYNGSAQVLSHHILELANWRLIGWLLRLSIFGAPSKIPPYNLRTPRTDIKGF